MTTGDELYRNGVRDGITMAYQTTKALEGNCKESFDAQCLMNDVLARIKKLKERQDD